MTLLWTIFILNTAWGATGPSTEIHLYPGFVTKIQCEGKLLVSAVGNETAVLLQALPAGLGCGVLLKPLVPQGKSNLLLETSTGSIKRLIDIQSRTPGPLELEYHLSGEAP